MTVTLALRPKSRGKIPLMSSLGTVAMSVQLPMSDVKYRNWQEPQKDTFNDRFAP